MQGIQLFDYKSLKEHLYKLQQAEVFNLPCEHADMISEHEEKLKNIYSNYQDAMEQVSAIIRQFEEHKQSIVRLKIHHRQCRKPLKKSKVIISDFNGAIINTVKKSK